MKNLFGVLLVAMVLGAVGASPAGAEICVTTGEGYASLAREPLDEITDLMVSPRPEDQERLNRALKKYLSEDYIFTLKAGVEVRTYLGEKGRPIQVTPVGSSKSYWVMWNGIKNCRSEW